LSRNAVPMDSECQITYLQGDATLPQAKGTKLIVHINNTYGGWGGGFASALTSRYGLNPARLFRKWHKERNHVQEPTEQQEAFRLGAVQFLQLNTYVWLGNMVAQQGLGGLKARHKPKKHNKHKGKRAMKHNDDDIINLTTSQQNSKEISDEDGEDQHNEILDNDLMDDDNEVTDTSTNINTSTSTSTSTITSTNDPSIDDPNVRVKYDALSECLKTVREKALELNATVHMPKIGTTLGGGNWDVIEPLLKESLQGISVYVYNW